MKNIAEWTEADLQALVGQAESSRLEFKSGRLASNRDQLVETLSKEVSAFANSEGGTLVLGIDEIQQGKSRVAGVVEGFAADIFTPEWLQQVVESHVSPFLPGMRFRFIRLSGDATGKACAVVSVPQGVTAYQANDRRYYGRSEYSVTALPDHEVRLRMQRGRAPRAEVAVFSWSDTGFERTPTRTSTHSHHLSEEEVADIEAEWAHAPIVDGEMVAFNFRLGIRNIGELTLHHFLVDFRFDSSEEATFTIGTVVVGDQAARRQRFDAVAGDRVLPGDFVPFPNQTFSIVFQTLAEARTAQARVTWKVFLHDAPPCAGALDLMILIKEAGLLGDD